MARARKSRPLRNGDLTLLVDSTLEDSFPASDPPSWTAGIVRPAPAGNALGAADNAGRLRRLLQRVAALF
jgi:hypothetical protein